MNGNESRFRAPIISLLACSSGMCFSSVQAQQAGPLAAEYEPPVPIRTVQEISFETSTFTFVRVVYSSGSQARSAGSSWQTDYPDADRAFSSQVERSIGLTVDPDGLSSD